MDLFNQMDMNLDENETKKLLQQIQTNPQFSADLKEALLQADHMKVNDLFKNEGIKHV